MSFLSGSGFGKNLISFILLLEGSCRIPVNQRKLRFFVIFSLRKLVQNEYNIWRYVAIFLLLLKITIVRRERIETIRITEENSKINFFLFCLCRFCIKYIRTLNEKTSIETYYIIYSVFIIKCHLKYLIY